MKLGRNDPCWCGSGRKLKKCHGVQRTPSELLTSLKKPERKLQIMTEAELPKMRRSCKLAANILEEVCSRVGVGVCTEDINSWVHDLTRQAGAYPAPLNYPKGLTDPDHPKILKGGFPKSVCTSVNEVVCHGIPSKKDILKDGDIVNIDVTCILDGYFGDTSRTIYIGTPSEEAKLVTETARECLDLAIGTVKAGSRLIDIGRVIENHAAKKHLGVVRDYTGHGVGRVFHTEPQVCHYPNKDTDMELIENMTFTIEPMINLGTWETRLDKKDQWTVYTLDGKISAQFEHTLLVTADGVEILTLPD